MFAMPVVAGQWQRNIYASPQKLKNSGTFLITGGRLVTSLEVPSVSEISRNRLF
jgi:hypothetical protein